LEIAATTRRVATRLRLTAQDSRRRAATLSEVGGTLAHAMEPFYGRSRGIGRLRYSRAGIAWPPGGETTERRRGSPALVGNARYFAAIQNPIATPPGAATIAIHPMPPGISSG